MKTKLILVFVFLQLFMSGIAVAHPGSGIVIDREGNVYFTDTGKGVWKIDATGKLTYLPASEFHWMAIDPYGHFSNTPKSFGNYFERVTTQNSKPALIICSDFPLVIGRDGNMYYANTRTRQGQIIRRAPSGKETVFAGNKAFEFITGIAEGPGGSIYIAETSNPNATTIRKIDLNGTQSIIATYSGKQGSHPPLETKSAYCRGLIVDSSGVIYLAATGSRSLLKITPRGNITTILETESPWTPTGVALFHGEVYMLEWHDVGRDNLEVRSAWIPRVRKIATDGKVTIIAMVSR